MNFVMSNDENMVSGDELTQSGHTTLYKGKPFTGDQTPLFSPFLEFIF